MKKEEIDWKAYREDLQASLSNERIWALGCTNAQNPHLQNIEDIEEELELLKQSDYNMVIHIHQDTPEYFDDFIINKIYTQFSIVEEELYAAMEELLLPEYYPKDYNNDTICTLACDEFFRVRKLIFQKIHFNEEEYLKKYSGISPLDFIRTRIQHKVLERIK